MGVVVHVVLCLLLRSRQLLGVGQVVHGDGKEHVEEGVVAEEGEHDEVQGVDVARPVPALRLDALI